MAKLGKGDAHEREKRQVRYMLNTEIILEVVFSRKTFVTPTESLGEKYQTPSWILNAKGELAKIIFTVFFNNSKRMPRYIYER